MGFKRLLSILLFIVFTCSVAGAETVTWSGAGGGYWNTSANWNTGSIPGPDDDVVINNSGDGSISVDSDTTIKALTLGGAKKIVLSTNSLTVSTPVPDTIYVSKSGSDSNPGTSDSPKLTIAGAVAAITGSYKKIHVSAGVYTENVTLNNGVSLYGGYSATDWNDRNITDRSNSAYRTVIQGITDTGTGYGVNFTGSSSAAWILEGFVIESNHTGNSSGVRVAYIDGTATIRYNTINGGPGSNESNGIYVNGPSSKMIVSFNDINGGASAGSNSNGIYIETAADQIITDNTINGGTGANSSLGIVVTFPLSSASVIARNSIDGGSSAGGQSYGIQLANYTDTSSLNVLIYGNYIRASNENYAYGIYSYSYANGISVQPGIFNNVIEAVATGSSGSRACGIYMDSLDGTPLVYNNIIAINSLSDQAYGIHSVAENADRATSADVRNNIFLCESSSPHDFAFLEYANGLSSYIQNNDIYNCASVINTGGVAYGTVAELNGLRSPSTSGNIDNNPVLSASPDRNLTASSPASVTQGGIDFSAVSQFPESGGNKIDKVGSARTAPWSIGAYERN